MGGARGRDDGASAAILDDTAAGTRETAKAGRTPPGLLVAIFAGCVLAMALALLARVQAMGARDYLMSMDFRAYYTAGRIVLAGEGSKLYDLPTQLQWQQKLAPELRDLSDLLSFLNPPYVAATLAPLAALPLETAYLAWIALNVALLAAASWLLIGALDGTSERVKLWALPLSLTFMPVWAAMMLGQISIVLVLAALGSWRALRSGHDLRAGLWLALALVKPQFVLLPALVLLMHRRTRALSGLAIGAAALLLISLLVVGWSGLVGFVQLLPAASSWGDAYGVRPQYMHTWRGFLSVLLGADNTQAVYVWWLAGVAIVLAVLIWAWRGDWSAREARFDLQWGALLAAALFISPHGYVYDLSLLIVSGALIMRYRAQRRQTGGLDTLLAALPLVGYAVVWAGTYSLHLQLQASVLFTLLVALALAWAAQHDRPPLGEPAG